MTRWLGVLAIGAVWLATAAYIAYIQDRARTDAAADLKNMTQAVTDLVGQQFSRISQTLQSTTRWIVVQGFDLTSPKPADVIAIRERIDAQLTGLPPTSVLAVIDAKGELLVAAPSVDLRVGKDELAHFQFADASRKPAIHIGSPIKSRLFDGIFIPVAMPIPTAHDEHGNGLVVAGIELFQITQVAKRFAALTGKRILLVNQSGDLLNDADGKSLPAGFAVLRSRIPAESSEYYGELDVDGHPYTVAARRLAISEDASILVAVSQDTDLLLAGYQSDKWEAIAFAVALSLMVLWFSRLLSRQFERREGTENALAEREKTLAQKHSELVDAQKLAKLGSWTTDATNRMEAPSEEYLRIYGLTADTCPATCEEWLARFVDSKQRVEAEENLRKMREGLPYEGTRLVTLADGSEKWVSFKALPVRDADGAHAGYRGVVRDVTVEKEAEQLLANKTEELETAKRIAGLGVWYWNCQTDALTVDARTREIYGITDPEGPLTLAAWGERFFTSEHVEACRPEYKRRFDGKPINSTHTITTANGARKWLHTLGSPVLDNHDQLIGYRGVSRDITSEKEAEQRLAESEERYRLISENMRDIVAVHDADGTVVYASPSLKRMLGYTVESTLGKTPFSLVHAEDLSHVKEALADIMEGRTEASSVWYRFRHKDGRDCWLETVIVPVRRSDGAIKHYQTATREITQRKQVELALRASEERFRSLTELSSDWYWELDAQFRFSFMSRDRTQYTRRAREELLGKTRWEIFPDALSPEEWAAHRAELEAHRPFYNLVLRVIDPATGETRGFSSLSGQPVFDESGRFTGYRGTGQDITERKLAEEALAKRTRELALTNKRLEEEARQRQQLERNFLMAIEMELAQVGLELHDDLGQDLTGVALLTKTLEKKLAEQGLAASEDAKRISELTNRAIKHTRMISHGLSPYIWGSAGLISALTQMANDITVLGTVDCEVDIDKKIEIEDEVVARNLYRIAQESVNNALKHSRARRIGISLSQTGKQISLTIADDGIGRADTTETDEAESKFHSIRHRANSINAKLSVRRGRRGGTVVKVNCQSFLEHFLPPHTEEMS